jgi:signal transduction histidine kinase
MSVWRLQPLCGTASLTAPPAAPIGALGLSRRLNLLQYAIERSYPMMLALDIVNRDGVDALPASLAAALEALSHEGTLNAARHSGATLTRLGIQVNGGTVLLSIEDDGKGFPFSGVYDLRALQALGVGPLRLMEGVAEWGGSLLLDSHATGTRLDIALLRDAPLAVRFDAAQEAA